MRAAKEDLFGQKILPLFEAYRADWLESARTVARMLGEGGATVTINDVRQYAPPPEHLDPRVMGAVFKPKEWECVGYVKSGRVTCHNRPIGVFRLKD